MRILAGAPGWLERRARAAARSTIARLPAVVRRRIADYRFGYTGDGPRFDFQVREDPDGLEVSLDARLRLRITAPFLEDLRFHFVDNAQSRSEIRAFIDASARLRPDALLFDVGAHRGLFSLVHCALGPARRAVLFEPSPSLAGEARELLTMNGFDARATVRTVGIGDRADRRRIVEDDLGFARTAESAGTEIDFVSLDDEWRRVGTPPDLLKIDVEGAEAEVVRGAYALFSGARPVVFLELHMDVLRARGEHVADLLEHLTRGGYRFFEPDGQERTAASISRTMRAIVRIVARADQ